MTSLTRIFIVTLIASLAACTPAKSPLAENDGATFALMPDRVKASAELGRATPESLGRPASQILHFSTCLQSLATGQNVANGARFVISDLVGGEMERAADPNGCVHWDEEHAVAPLAPERNVRVERRLKALGNHRGTVTLAFNVKPWLEGGDAVQSALNLEKYADAINARIGFSAAYPIKSEVAATAADLDTASRFDLADNALEFNYVEISRSREFAIDSFLNLSIPYRYAFALSPRITRRLFSGALKSEPMSSGRVRLTFVFFASSSGEFHEDTSYLTSAQIDGTVNSNGRLTGTLQIKYPHMLFASGRQTVLLQISSPDQPSVKTTSFAGSLSTVDHKGVITLIPDARDADQIHRASSRQRAEIMAARKTPFEEYLANHGVVRTNVEAMPDESTVTDGKIRSQLVTREELAYALDQKGFTAEGFARAKSHVPIADRLCHAYLRMAPPATSNLGVITKADYLESLSKRAEAASGFGIAEIFQSRSKWLDARVGEAVLCDQSASAENAVTVRRYDFIESLADSAPRNVNIHTYSNMDFAVYYAHDSQQATVSGIGIGASVANILGINASYTKTWGDLSTQGGKFGQSQTVAIDVGLLEVNASVRRCVIVTDSNIKTPRKPWVICETKPRAAAWVPEQFYYFSQMFGSNHSPFIDPFNAESGIKFLVRDHARMLSITQRLADTDIRKTGFNLFINSHVPNLHDFNTTEKVDDLTDQDIPGAIRLN